jgi:hypothetical protein
MRELDQPANVAAVYAPKNKTGNLHVQLICDNSQTHN